MILFISQIFSVEIEKKTFIVISMSNDLGEYFKNLDYGNDLIELGINLICVSSEFEQFFIPRKPKYIKGKKIIISNLTKQKHEIERSLEYDFKMDFETFKNATESEAEKILAKEILQSLTVLEDMKKKIKDFDVERFKSDLQDFFKEKGLI